MQCSWKTMLLLAFTSIAIQYTAIRTLTSNPLHLCQFASIQNCSLGDREKVPPLERVTASTAGCDDPYLSNATRKTHILILAATRTGSTFFSQLLNQHQDVFYLFEPLYHVQTTLMSQLSHIRSSSEYHMIQGASRDLLRSLYNCDLYALENYIRPRPANHMTHRLFRRGTSRALCHTPVCDAFGPSDFDVYEWTCVSKCGPLNMTLAIEACQENPYVAIKTVRMGYIEDARALVEDPRLNVKVIQLVRDPRGILSSRIETFIEPYRLWRVWKQTGRRPDNIDLSPVKGVCDDFFNSVSTGLSKPSWLKGKYMVVRYEDLARNTLEKTKEIYNYLGLSLNKSVKDWISAHTQVSNVFQTRLKFGTSRNSAANAENWRLRLSYDIVEYIQSVCEKALHQLGYKTVKSAEELRNMSFSLIEDKTFEPFF